MIKTSAAALSKMTAEDIKRELRKYYGFQKNIAIVSAFGFAFVWFCTRMAHAPAVVQWFAGLSVLFCILCFIYTFVMQSDVSRCPFLKKHGGAFELSMKIQTGADKILYQDHKVIVTADYIIPTDRTKYYILQYQPLKEILLFFGFYDDNNPSYQLLWCMDERAIEHKYECSDPWEACRAMMPYMSGRARYSEEDAEIKQIMREIREYAKENRH